MELVSYDIHDQTRQRMLADTSRFIEWGLRHPDLVVRIPAKPVGVDPAAAAWPPALGRYFWNSVLLAADIRNAGAGMFRRLISKVWAD